MEEILLSDKIKDYKIDFAERDADFHMDRFHYHPYYEIYSTFRKLQCTDQSFYLPPGSGRFCSDSAIHHAPFCV